ncbi:MAG: ATP-binding cassette domain-containing protein, partial [Muribaculaceae bacterium]|nr:ATP-binding cassette domain-containing protein [Muribaculaceae bacterium]
MKQHDFIISLDSQSLGYGKVILQNPYQIKIAHGVTVVYGENGSGKTTLATILEKGRYAYGNRLNFADGIEKIKMLSFIDIHSLSGMEVQYYVQRMEATMNDMVPTVADIMGDKIHSTNWTSLNDSLGLKDVTDKKINYLSSGELRKLLIINALLDNPDVLILDNPYIGLDAGSRDEFDNTMRDLREQGVSVIMLLCDTADIPEYTDSLIVLSELTIKPVISDKNKIREIRDSYVENDFNSLNLPLAIESQSFPHQVAFAINKGHIRYGAREILKDVDWVVKKGEHWVLTGPNGCGKSLLLSLVCADNPQAYANDITLFDRKRGSGESIWEIKDAIGYVSPEMQLFFKSNSSVRDIIVQGMRNSLNKYRPATKEETDIADSWMNLLGIADKSQRKFSELSTGEQRLVLVARAMIKQPPLLVLDEPLHGLAATRKSLS